MANTDIARTDLVFSVPRILVIGSWSIFIVAWIVALPIPPEATTKFLLAVLASVFGIVATLSVLLRIKLWRLLAVISAGVYLLTYCVYVVLSSLDLAETWRLTFLGGVGDFYSSIWKILLQFLNTYGFAPALTFAFVEMLMPVTQLAILIALIRPNHAVENDAPRASRRSPARASHRER
jgi:hypothetical protein